MKCEGSNVLDTTPPGFIRFIETVVAVAGEDKNGPIRMLKYLREQENERRKRSAVTPDQIIISN